MSMISGSVTLHGSKGEVLRRLLEKTGTSQGQLSRLTGVPQGRISTYVNGREGLSDDMLEYLLMPLGVEVEHTWTLPVPELTSTEQLSWEMHKRLSELLTKDTLESWHPKLCSNINRQRSSNRGQPHLRNIDRWHELIEGRDLRKLRHPMLDPSRNGVEMREVTPFVGLLPQDDRNRILQKERTRTGRILHELQRSR